MDLPIREAERRWRKDGDAEAAGAYLLALERAGLLPDQTPVEIPQDAAPISIFGVAAGVTTLRGEGWAAVIVDGVPIAAVVDGDAIWSSEACNTGHRRSHARRWLIENNIALGWEDSDDAADDAADVPAARLVDLLRLVPVSMFWNTCDACMEPRRGVARHHDGLDLCAPCAGAEGPPPANPHSIVVSGEGL